MSQKTNSKGVRRNAGTQTQEMDTILEIARLQEQVKLLTMENEHLRKYTIEKPTPMIKSRSPTASPTNLIETPKHSELSRLKKQENQSARRKSAKRSMRGCNCKTNCASQKCGCVKKNNQCGEWCRCSNSVCQNQEEKDEEQNKENLEENVNEVDREEVTNKHLENATAQKGLFSPDIMEHNEDHHIEKYENTSLYFGSPKKLTFPSDEEEENETIKNELKNVPKSRTRRNRSKKNVLEVNNTEHVQRQRSLPNDRKKDRSTKTEVHRPNRARSSKTNNQADDKLQNIEQRTNNYLQNIKNGMMTLRRGQKERGQGSVKEANTENHAEKLDSEEENAVPSANQDHENQAPVKLKSKDLDTNKSSDALEEDFDPMKPKHELPRTPTHGSSEKSHQSISETYIPQPIATNETEQLPFPAEFSQVEVNWDEYQSQLVSCDKCKRRFHPLRIKKHQSCCKKL